MNATLRPWLLVTLMFLGPGCAADRLEGGLEVRSEDAGGGPEDAAPDDVGQADGALPDVNDPEVDEPFDGQRPDEGCEDLDGDGSPGTGQGCDPQLRGFDCNDGDPMIGPGADELCDGVDQDCDGQADEGVLNPCGGCGQLDGVPGDACGMCGALECEGPRSVRCVEGDGRAYFEDEDGDGFGVGEPRVACAPDERFRAPRGGDCDDGNGMIHPGAIEVCDGVDNDCDPMSSEEQVCPVLHLPAGGARWEALITDRDDPDAPRTPVRAAFDLESFGRAFLLTDTTWHLFSLSNGNWLDSGPLDEVMPEVAGAGSVRYAYSIPAAHVGGFSPVVTVVAGGGIFIYEYLFVGVFRLRDVLSEDPWSSPLAPRPDEVLAAWLAVDYAETWFRARPGDFCAADGDPPLRVLLTVMTATSQHVMESGHCFDFIERVSNGLFEPWDMPGAPSPATIDAAFWNEGLYVVRNP